MAEKTNGAVPPDRPIAALQGLVSVIVPCCGMLEYTKLCVPSLLRHTRPPFEMIFIDIGSLDGTAEYLAGVAAASRAPVTVIRALTDLDIPRVCDEAISAASGEYVVVLNNDTIVTDSWLNQLIGLSSLTPAIGMVGPMSNYAAPPQLVETVPYRIGPKKGGRALGVPEFLVDVSAVSAFAAEFREKHKGQWLEVERLGGFCLLIKRQVLYKILSALEKWTDLTLFDTDILSAKARQAGFTLACCRDLYIHHFGTRQFAHGAPAERLTTQATDGHG